MSHSQNSIKKYFQASRSSASPFHPQMALISINPGQDNGYNNMNCVGFDNDGMNMLARQIRNIPYIEQQNVNGWNRNVSELIEYNNMKNANVNYVQDDMNSFGNDFTDSRNYNYTNNFNSKMPSLENMNPRMMAHPYFDKQKFDSAKPKNVPLESDGYRKPFSNISNMMTLKEKSPNNYVKLPTIDENTILRNNTPAVPKFEGTNTQETFTKPITVIESPRAGVITTVTKQPTPPEKPKATKPNSLTEHTRPTSDK